MTQVAAGGLAQDQRWLRPRKKMIQAQRMIRPYFWRHYASNRREMKPKAKMLQERVTMRLSSKYTLSKHRLEK